MRELEGIRFTGDLQEDYRSSVPRENPAKNGREYEFYLRFVNILADGVKGLAPMPYLYGDIDPRFLERRFFGKRPYLITEREEVNGFPDFALLNDDIVVIFDHFKIDASKPFGNTKKASGTEYMRFRGASIQGAERTDPYALEAALSDAEIELSVGALKSNLEKKYHEKAAKIGAYRTRVHEHIATGRDERIVSSDLSKALETWLMVEDLSPTCGFEHICQTLSELLEKYPSINGLLYISNPYPDEMFSNPRQVALIANDEKARAELRRIGG